jgi:hypothetical protein
MIGVSFRKTEDGIQAEVLVTQQDLDSAMDFADGGVWERMDDIERLHWVLYWALSKRRAEDSAVSALRRASRIQLEKGMMGNEGTT